MSTLVEVLRKRGIPWRKGRRSQIRICCPFCIERGETQDTRFRLEVNTYTDQAHCFNCDWRAGGKGAQRVLRQFGIHEATETTQNVVVVEPHEKLSLPNDFRLLVRRGTEELEQMAFDYLLSRGVTVGQRRKYKIGVAFTGRFAYRILFPIYIDGKLRMLSGRDFTGRARSRYLHSTGVKFLHAMSIAPRPKCVLSEGIFKSLAIERVVSNEGWDSYALHGHSINDAQMEQLRKAKVREIVVWPDPDKVGMRKAIELCNELAEHEFKVSIVPNPPAQADELSATKRRLFWGRRLVWGFATQGKIKALQRAT